MATPPEQPWSNQEKNFLLAEIIKAANPPANLLYGIIRQNNFQPRWEDIPLPPNRSLNSCRYAFDDLQRSLSIPPLAAPFAPNAPPPILTQGAIKRPYPFESSSYSGSSVGSGREIRPKPVQSGPSLYTQPSPTEPPPKRKRGRPTKAEALAKAEAAAAAGPTDPRAGSTSRSLPPIQTPSSATSSAPTLVAPVPEERSILAATTASRIPIAAMLTPTARDPKSASQSSSSSGKRRRARSQRSTRSDAEETPVGRSSNERYESPYSRMAPGSQDSPARAAVLRHRDDPSSAPRTAPSEGTKEPEQH